jgi:hypothetical protein
LFLKVEKWPEYDDSVGLKAPRAIQHRGPRFNLCLAKYLCPFEERFYTGFATADSGRFHTSKGLSPDRRAQLIVELWNRRQCPMALCVDASRFDAHVVPAFLKWEASVYTRCVCGDKHLLKWLLKQQLLNRGTTPNGLRYVVPGCRMSGDINTSLGNTLIQLSLLEAIASGKDVDILVEGDDAVIFCERSDSQELARRLVEWSADVGMKYKSSVASALEDIDYCSTRLVETQPGVWRSTRSFQKALETDLYTPRHVLTESAARSKARVVAVCQAVQYGGLPVFSAWAAYLLSHTSSGRRLDEWFDRGHWLVTRERLGVPVRDAGEQTSPGVNGGRRPGLQCLGPVSPLARESFYCAWGLWPSEQMALEAAMEALCGNGPAEITGAEEEQLLAHH